MADDTKKKDKGSKPKPKGGTPLGAGGAGPPGMDPSAGGPPLGMPPIGGAAPGGSPSMGAPPPMPGSGVDPYAALMGQVSSAPMSMPMGGPEGMGGAGMGNGLQPPGMESPQSAMMGGPPGGDPITAALMSDANPAASQPDLAEHALDPQMMGQEQMSVQQLLEMLALMQGGIPTSGLQQPGHPGSLTAGMGSSPLSMG